MSINTILGNALSGLNASQAGLRQTSNNIANVNTSGYARTTAPAIARQVAGQSLGVTQAEVQRITDRFLLGASLSASSDAAASQAIFNVLDRIQAQFGAPGDPNSVFSRLNTTFSDIGIAAQDPASSVRRLEAINSINSLFAEFSRLGREIQVTTSEVQQQINSDITRVNQLISEIQDLNIDVARGQLSGDATGAQNRQAALLDELGQLIDIRVNRNELGTAQIRTQDGVLLLGAFAHTLQPSTGANGSYSRITATSPSGSVIDLQAHISGGSLYGLLTTRDTELAELALELSEFAAGTADALNQAHAEATSVPQPSLLTGRNTGLIASDTLNLSGAAVIALTDVDGNLLRRIDINFNSNILAVDGGAAQPVGTTIGSLTAALDAAFGPTATVTFLNGSLVLNTNSTDGIGFLQDPLNPTDRAGRSFAGFFGINELVTSAKPSFFDTGISAADPHGFPAGQTLEFSIAPNNGRTATDITVTIGGANFTDILASLNNPTTGLGRFANFALDANGRLISTPVPGAEGYKIDLRTDNTLRTGTNSSFSQIFGLGDQVLKARTSAFSVRADIANNPSLLALGQLDVGATTVVGDFVAGIGDGRGGFRIQQALETARNFQSAGSLSATTSSLTEFAGRFAVTTGSRAANAERAANASLSLSAEADFRRANIEGVNIDEELAALTLFQQSYNAAARLIQTARELNDILLRLI
ncbi:MAG: flagellar hook-associated protein FlgK [Robiginitomaculum sp.]|nr:flagellar hook-associated protein FlgK [Robiginitomaculum sp.]